LTSNSMSFLLSLSEKHYVIVGADIQILLL